jgi:diguanylate cyclase (GGDEF)-like protein
MPHGMCLAWQQNVLLLQVISDGLIALAYLSIPLTLGIFAWKRRDLPFKGLVAMFVVFILACGTTHLMAIWTVWHPDYWLDGFVKAFTAVASIITAVTLVRLLPKALALRSPEETERLGALAFVDDLTGLPNRALLHDRLAQTILAAKRRGEQFAVMFVDLDGFKEINDRFGHDAGDVVLQIVAARLKEQLRQSDTVGRLGGDEFVIVGAAVATMADASRFAERLLRSMRMPISNGPSAHRVSASIGVSFYPLDGTDSATLLRRADGALYDAKRSGKNRVHFATPEVQEPRAQGESEDAEALLREHSEPT